MVKIGQSLVSWKAKKQSTVSRSSTEAEYRSLASTMSELVWLLGMLKEVDAEIQLSVQICSNAKLLFKLLQIQYIMKGQNTLRLTVIS
ncbi:hypothetical protein MTR67_028894 [Solanum verrucosum]|uniref:Uncharacterized protein n=1 Tax=Solanum verrucosum TaxID=315347 RepID=A0AAF0RBZ3_SOLVR|nr:hypothetical protein MTR67_028894 [Solanum verrucosum]